MDVPLTPAVSDVAGGAPVEPGAQSSRGRLVLRRFLRSRKAVCGLAAIVLLFLLAYLGPWLTPWGYTQMDSTALLQPPSAQH